MEYPFIDIKSIFVYKALPSTMNHRVTQLPPKSNIDYPLATGFEKVDATIKKEWIKTIDWQQIPERNLTQCALIDTFSGLVHQHGAKSLIFYTKLMGNRYNSTVLGNAIEALTGIRGQEFVIRYTLLMIRDIECRTNLNKTEIAQCLGFTSLKTLYQFIQLHGKKLK